MAHQRENAVLSQERMRELLDYDSETGVFTWKQNRQGGRGIKPGARAGTVKPTGGGKKYRYIRIDGVDYLAKRLAWFWSYDKWPSFLRCLDGNEDNCSIGNLADHEIVRGPAGSSRKNRVGQRQSYNAKNPEKVKDWHLRTKFGITLQAYRDMNASQGGVCAICGKPEDKKRYGVVRGLAVDHCHSTDKVRGLLCGNCNPMIGYAKDDTMVLQRAIEYINAHKGAT